jgi:hypothetical protein
MTGPVPEVQRPIFARSEHFGLRNGFQMAAAWMRGGLFGPAGV